MITIPSKFNLILQQNQKLTGIINSTASTFGPIFTANNLEFFPEYTDHGIRHVENVLKAAERIIDDETYKLLTAEDVAIIILSVFLHDIGMHLSLSNFIALLAGTNDDVIINEFHEIKWIDLWDNYLEEAKRFSSIKRKEIFGKEDVVFRKPPLNRSLEINIADKLLIGEFIRRNHPRIAHEIAIKGLSSNNGSTINFANDLDYRFKQIVGVVARSHGLEIRDTFNYLISLSEYEWARQYGINIIFLMVVLRIADYFQFDASRIDIPILKLRTFISPISQLEFNKHLAINFTQTYSKDPETLYVEATPTNSVMYLKLKELFGSIQYELDISWATLGEIYGKETNQPKIKYRRIKSNLDINNIFTSNLDFVPEKINFSVDQELPKLLIGPLYGENPTYGVREILQNAIDACKEREELEKGEKNSYKPLVKVSLLESEKRYFIEFSDNGKGMQLQEITNYFLKAGSSYRKSLDWQKKYIDSNDNVKIIRNGKFGIGVLAAFLLGDELNVTTKSMVSEVGYTFSATLDTGQIEVLKCDCPIGTTIKIEVSEQTVRNLLNNPVVNWDRWFYLSKPVVTYKHDVISIIKNSFTGKEYHFNNSAPDLLDELPKNWHSIVPENFNKVNWSFTNNKKLVCNGILIPQDYKLQSDIISTPSIYIYDLDGKLELNLNRNKINGSLPFDEQLLEDVAKDKIAQLLLYEPRYLLNDKSIKSNKNYKEKGWIENQIYYNKFGFVWNYNYVIEKANILKHVVLGLNPTVRGSDTFNLINELSEKFMYSFKFIYIGSLANIIYYLGDSNTSQYLQFNSPTRVIIPKNLYNLIFKDELNKVTVGVKKNHRLEETNSDWVIFNYKLFRKTLSIPNDLSIDSNQIYFFREKMTENQVKSENIIDKLLEKYLQNDPIIPYMVKDREQKFKKAFKELRPYMQKYI